MESFVDVCVNIKNFTDKNRPIDDNLVIQAISSFKYIIGMNWKDAHLKELKILIPYVTKAFEKKGSSFYLNDNMVKDYPVSMLFERYFPTSFSDDNLSFDYSKLSLILIDDILSSKYDNIYPTKQDKSDYINSLIEHSIPYYIVNIKDICDIFKKYSDSDFFINSYIKQVFETREDGSIENLNRTISNFKIVLEFMKKSENESFKEIENKNKFLFKSIVSNNSLDDSETQHFKIAQDYFKNISEKEKTDFINYFITEIIDIFHYSWPMMSTIKSYFAKEEKGFLSLLQLTDQNKEQQIELINTFLKGIDQSQLYNLYDRNLHNYFIKTQIDIEKEKINSHIYIKDSLLEKQKKRI